MSVKIKTQNGDVIGINQKNFALSEKDFLKKFDGVLPDAKKVYRDNTSVNFAAATPAEQPL